MDRIYAKGSFFILLLLAHLLKVLHLPQHLPGRFPISERMLPINKARKPATPSPPNPQPMIDPRPKPATNPATPAVIDRMVRIVNSIGIWFEKGDWYSCFFGRRRLQRRDGKKWVWKAKEKNLGGLLLTEIFSFPFTIPFAIWTEVLIILIHME